MRQLYRITIRFFGKVQGVGFRKAVFQIIDPWNITGFVQNCPDGTVLVVMESPQEKAADLIQELQKTFLLTDVQSKMEDCVGDLSRFYVKF